MELLNSKSVEINTFQKEIAWQFLRDAHLEYLLMFPKKLNAILNEYLFFHESQV
jgi:hypothetical protein